MRESRDMTYTSHTMTYFQDRSFRSASISRFKGQKKKYTIAGTLSKGPKWILKNGSTGCRFLPGKFGATFFDIQTGYHFTSSRKMPNLMPIQSMYTSSEDFFTNLTIVEPKIPQKYPILAILTLYTLSKDILRNLLCPERHSLVLRGPFSL